VIQINFNELFLNAINKLGWSQNYISTKFNINRGKLHKYYHAQLQIPKQTFQTLLCAMELSAGEKKALCEAYYTELYGAEKFSRIKYIESALTKLDEHCTAPPPESIPELKMADPEKITCLSSQDEMAQAAHWMFQNAAPGKVITNYPYACRELDDAVFRNIAANPGFSLLHMLTFDKGSGGLHNLENIFRSVRWLQYHINPVCRYDYPGSAACLPFPCFLAVNDYCLLFHPKQEQGIFVKNSAVFQHLQELSALFVKSSFPLAVFPKDMMEFKNEVSRAVLNQVQYSLSAYPCLSPIADEEFIYSIVKRDILGFEFLAQLAIQHYSEVFMEQETYIMSASGLMEFANTGEVREIPGIFIHEAPPAQRIRYFQKLIEFLKTEQKVMILDDASFSLPDSIAMGCFENMIQIDGRFENVSSEMQHYGNYMISIEDKELKEDLADFLDYLRENKYFYSRNAAKSYLESLILLCEQME